MSSPEASHPEPESTFEINLGRLTVQQVMRLERLITNDMHKQQELGMSEDAEVRASAESPYELVGLVTGAIDRLSDSDLEASKRLVSGLAEQEDLVALKLAAWGAVHVTPRDFEFATEILSRVNEQETRTTGWPESWRTIVADALTATGIEAIPPEQRYALATRVLPPENADEFMP
jgi:hypothetical protein